MSGNDSAALSARTLCCARGNSMLGVRHAIATRLADTLRRVASCQLPHAITKRRSTTVIPIGFHGGTNSIPVASRA